MPILKPSFPSYNRTPKHHGYLNTLHPNPRDEFRACWSHVEEFLVAGEQEIVHTKPFFFPFSSAATCTNHPLEVDQRHGPCERDDPICRFQRVDCDIPLVAFSRRHAFRRYPAT
ncbi:hypothetical protein Taro_003582 [Colocasia esculenta]|uniref:Uncharacterized protein n=1 Tax=Colocasia esculenta TaxID=4460 RepID=A0A843TPA6_COLES|nr:hypothetical protein [Colocasia esculenta]